MTTKIVCNPEGKLEDKPTGIKATVDSCNAKINLTHKSGCPIFSVNSWIAFLMKYPWVIAVLMIVFGAVVTFFGMKFFRYTIAVAAGGATFLVSMLLLSVFGMLDGLSKEHGSIALAVLGFIIGLGLAVLAGYLLFKLEKIGATLIAATCGFVLGTTLYNLVFFWTQ